VEFPVTDHVRHIEALWLGRGIGMETALTEALRLQDIGPLVPRVRIVSKASIPNEYAGNPAGAYKGSHDAPFTPAEH
jgi:hypothetical protein